MNLVHDPSVAVRQIQDMLLLQYQMNAHIHPEWEGQKFPWYRAIWTESAEMLDHHGWKWWKMQEPDWAQVKLELVDIWHFGMSEMLQRFNDLNGLTLTITHDLCAPHDENPLYDFGTLLELFVAKTISSRRFEVSTFIRLMSYVEMDLDELYALYIGKNTLNFFRQDNGYKEGTYQKIWDGREDNEHLFEILETLDTSEPQFQNNLYEQLDARYPG